MRKVASVMIVSLLLLCGFVTAYRAVCEKCGAAEECLARGHEWFFKEVTFRVDSDTQPGTEDAYYVWICDECGVTISKSPAELTLKEELAIQELNHEGKMRVFRLKSDITWRERFNIGR